VPAEVDQPERPLVSPATVPYGDAADIVPPASPLLADGERLVRPPRRYVGRTHDRHEPPGGGGGPEAPDRHDLHRLEELDRLFARPEGHVGLLPVRAPPEGPPHPLLLAAQVLGAHRRHLHLEDRLDRLADLDLVGPAIAAER